MRGELEIIETRKQEVRIILNDKTELLTACMKDYSGLILTICYAMTRDYFDAEDLAQETFVAAYRNFGQFDGRSMKAWLTTIAANKCRDFLKNAARRVVPAEVGTFEKVADGADLPEEILLKDEAAGRMRKLCQKLKEPYRTVSIQHFCENRSITELSKAGAINQKTLQTQLYRAKSMLKALWKEEYH